MEPDPPAMKLVLSYKLLHTRTQSEAWHIPAALSHRSGFKASLSTKLTKKKKSSRIWNALRKIIFKALARSRAKWIAMGHLIMR